MISSQVGYVIAPRRVPKTTWFRFEELFENNTLVHLRERLEAEHWDIIHQKSQRDTSLPLIFRLLEWYCSCFQNPKANHRFGCIEPL